MTKNPDIDPAKDPFYIDPKKIPAGKAYQWVSLEQASSRMLAQAKDDGWKPVKWRKGLVPTSYRIKGQVVYRDTLLMEHTANHVAVQRAKEINDALRMDKESDPRGHASAQIIFKEYTQVPHNAPPITVEIAISFSMDRAWQEAASFLGLSNEEYARRRVLMTNPVLIKDEYESSYRPAYIRGT